MGQKQLDDLHLAPCRHLCRWRGETHRWVERLKAFSHHAALVGMASSICYGNVFFKNNDSATVTQSVFRRHFDIGRNGKVPTLKQY